LDWHRKGRRLSVFANRELRGIFGTKVEEVAEGCRRPRNEEELYKWYASSNIRMIESSSMRWAGHVARMEDIRNAYNILVGKLEGEGPLTRPRRIW
jgi:hypothetical protein